VPEHPDPKARAHPFRVARAACPPVAAGPARSGMPYAELSVTTNFTFLTGASHPEEFVERAAELGHAAAAISDTNTLAGVVRAHVAAKEAGMPLAVGCRLVFTESDGCTMLVYPTSREAHANLCRLLTVGKRRAAKGRCRLSLHDVVGFSAGLLCVVEPARVIDDRCIETLEGLRRVFDDDRISLAASRLYTHEDTTRLRMLRDLAAHVHIPLVATNACLYHDPSRRALQDVVTCIREGCTIDRAGMRLEPSAERHLKAPEEMARLFADCPGACERAAEVALRASAFSLDEIRYEYPVEDCPEGVTPMEHLRDLAWSGAWEKYGEAVPQKVVRSLEHELGLIEELGYEAYFLTCYEIVQFARSRGILCQGRGGAANSAVCYCIGVTPVDPARFELLFERFVSRERNEPPDIDIDFEHERREEVIQHIYAKYGRSRAALTAEVITYRARSAVRDVGKAMGLSLDRVDLLAKNLDRWSDGPADERVREIGLDPRDATTRRVIELTGELIGFPRHLSQHVGGFVITRTDLCGLVPIENAAMPDRTVIEWDKDDIDAMGMLKVDVLGLGMLSAVGRAIALLGRDGETERRRDEVGKARRTAIERSRSAAERDEETQRRRDEVGRQVDGACEDISGSRSVAEGDGVGAGRLPGDRCDAAGRAVRADDADAPRGGVGPLEHRRGVRAPESGGSSEVPAHRARIAQRAGHADRAGVITREDAGDIYAIRAHRGDGPRPASPHPKSRKRDDQPLTPTPTTTPSLRLSVSPSLHNTYYTIASSPTDPSIYTMLSRADTIGVFQIESRAQMTMLPRMKPREFYDLVIEVAIVRPGPIQGKMVHPYLRRRAGEEAFSFPSVEVERVLGRTLGVPLFQEQAMQLAIVAAGFTPDEADNLRRAMASWKRKGDEIYRFGRKIIDGMIERGYSREFAERCFEQIKGFSEYGFPESHAAAFAILVYVSAWLKRYHPAAFAAALVNSQPMGFYAPAQLVRDAQEHGVEVRGVDVGWSGWDCSLEQRHEGTEARRHGGNRADRASDRAASRVADDAPSTWGHGGPALRLGMRLVKGMREDDAHRIADAVRERGPFDSIEDLWRVSGCSARSLRCLAQADAFGSMGVSRREALWAVRGLKEVEGGLFDRGTEARRHEGTEGGEEGNRADRASDRTGTRGECVVLPPAPEHEQTLRDYASVGLTLRRHPVSFVRERLAERGAIPARELADAGRSPQGRFVRVAGLALVRQRPATASGIVFITIEDESGVANLIVRPRTFERYRKAARLSACILAEGRVERQGQVVHIQTNRLHSLDGWLAGLSARSRDFH